MAKGTLRTQGHGPKDTQTEGAIDRFRALFDQAPISTQIFSADGTAIAVNPAWERLFGVTLADIPGYNILHDDQLTARGVMPLIRRAFDGEAVRIPPIKYVPEETIADTGAVPFLWVGGFMYAVRDESGAIREVVLMHEDITERVLADEALRESEERFRTTFTDAPVGISLLDSNGRYVSVNPARQEMLGYSEDELVGRTYEELTHSDDLEYDRQVNAEARALGRDRFQLEKRFRRKDGTTRWARITANMIRDEHGDLRYTLSIAEDITDVKEAEEERDRLERQMEDFLSAAAHDLRTPLTSIKGRIQLLERRSNRGILEPAATIDELQRIDASASRMMALINELLDVANIRIGHPLGLVKRPADLVELAGRLVSEHQQTTDAHQIVLDADVPELVGAWDATRLERVLGNLLANAIKFSPDGGEIVVRITPDATDGWVILSVRDTGIGIPATDLPLVFERFHRAGNVAGRITGTGIGLSAARQIIEQHGGTIEADSVEGEGSTFTVRLPVRTE